MGRAAPRGRTPTCGGHRALRPAALGRPCSRRCVCPRDREAVQVGVCRPDARGHFPPKDSCAPPGLSTGTPNIGSTDSGRVAGLCALPASPGTVWPIRADLCSRPRSSSTSPLRPPLSSCGSASPRADLAPRPRLSVPVPEQRRALRPTPTPTSLHRAAQVRGRHSVSTGDRGGKGSELRLGPRGAKSPRGEERCSRRRVAGGAGVSTGPRPDSLTSSRMMHTNRGNGDFWPRGNEPLDRA